MNKSIILFAFILITISLNGQSIPDTIVVTVNYELRKQKPFIAYKNEIIINQTDSLFLVNKIRYTYYEKLKALVTNPSFIPSTSNIAKFKTIIDHKDLQFESLAKKCNAQSRLADTTIAQIKSSLLETDRNLEKTKISLINANKSISEAQDHLKKIQRKQFWQKLSILGGGVGIGLLVGILIN